MGVNLSVEMVGEDRTGALTRMAMAWSRADAGIYLQTNAFVAAQEQKQEQPNNLRVRYLRKVFLFSFFCPSASLLGEVPYLARAQPLSSGSCSF